MLLLLFACDKDNRISQDEYPGQDSSVVTADGQLYNMSFDQWSKDGKYYECFGSAASGE